MCITYLDRTRFQEAPLSMGHTTLPLRSIELCRGTLKFHVHHLSGQNSFFRILLDSKLSWKAHISELCNKLSRSVGMLFKIPKCVFRICIEIDTLYFILFTFIVTYRIGLLHKTASISIVSPLIRSLIAPIRLFIFIFRVLFTMLYKCSY